MKRSMVLLIPYHLYMKIAYQISFSSLCILLSANRKETFLEAMKHIVTLPASSLLHTVPKPGTVLFGNKLLEASEKMPPAW